MNVCAWLKSDGLPALLDQIGQLWLSMEKSSKKSSFMSWFGLKRKKERKNEIRNPLDRKVRLFACACCRRIWNLLPDDFSRNAVETAEQFSDGQVGEDVLGRVGVEGVSKEDTEHPTDDNVLMQCKFWRSVKEVDVDDQSQSGRARLAIRPIITSVVDRAERDKVRSIVETAVETARAVLHSPEERLRWMEAYARRAAHGTIAEVRANHSSFRGRYRDESGLMLPIRPRIELHLGLNGDVWDNAAKAVRYAQLETHAYASAFQAAMDEVGRAGRAANRRGEQDGLAVAEALQQEIWQRFCDPVSVPTSYRAEAQERQHQIGILRDIFGNFFHPVTLKASWLSWSNGFVPKLAESIYESRRFADMPILADTLEEAGCKNKAILDHCRASGEHVRGCWVLDLVRNA
jgi:hypothetical protein